jgi:hypothetical protein
MRCGRDGSLRAVLIQPSSAKGSTARLQTAAGQEEVNESDFAAHSESPFFRKKKANLPVLRSSFTGGNTAEQTAAGIHDKARGAL